MKGRSHSEWDGLAKVASLHGFQGWLARELRGRESIPPPFQIELQGAAARIALNHRHRTADATTALAALHATGISAMLLKGPDLVERHYGDTTLRSYGDVDLYVHPTSFRTAVEALTAAGFTLMDRNWKFLIQDLRGQLHFTKPGGGTIELHWHLVNGLRQRRTLKMSHEESWEAVIEHKLGDLEYLTLPPGDEMAYLCLHAAMHGCNRLIWLVDIAVLSADRDMDWDQTVRRLLGWNFGAGGHLVLRLAGEWTGATVPPEVLRTTTPGSFTTAAFRRLVGRADLAIPPSRLRELFFASAGDRARTRLGLVTDYVVPAPGQRGEVSSRAWIDNLHRITMGTVQRVRGKLAGSGVEGFGAEYDAAGDSVNGRERYLAAVEAFSAANS